MATKEIKQWITINGVHVPIYEGETKADAAKRAIFKQKENIKKNESDKEKDIARNQANKDKANYTDKIKEAYKNAWDKKSDYADVEKLKNESGLSKRELAGIKNDAESEYEKARKDSTKDKPYDYSKEKEEIKGYSDKHLQELQALHSEQLKNATTKEAWEDWNRKAKIINDEWDRRNAIKDKDNFSNATSGKASDEARGKKSEEKYSSKMTKKEQKASMELSNKVWDYVTSNKSNELTSGSAKVDGSITYVNSSGKKVTSNIKYVRWDGAIVTTSGDFIWGDTDRILDVDLKKNRK